MLQSLPAGVDSAAAVAGAAVAVAGAAVGAGAESMSFLAADFLEASVGGGMSPAAIISRIFFCLYSSFPAASKAPHAATAVLKVSVGFVSSAASRASY